MFYIEQLEEEFKKVQEELMDQPLIGSDCRIGDFGCGSGYATLGLMLALDATECIGVDKNDVWDLPTIREAKEYFNTLTEYPSELQDLVQKVQRLLGKDRWPTFQKRDILDTQDLPNNLDFVHSKLLLVNIYHAQYHNTRAGEDGVSHAINNIANCIKPDGYICLAEEEGFEHIIKKIGLICVSKSNVPLRKSKSKVVMGIDVGMGYFTIGWYRKP